MKLSTPQGHAPRRAAASVATLLAALFTPLSTTLGAAHAAETWTLESSIARAIEAAPEIEMRAAAIRAQQGAALQAGAWPNPSIEIRADNRLGREFDDGGYEVTGLAVSQPLAWGVGRARRAVAERELAVFENAAQSERLDIERDVALAYHRLQRGQALLELARQAVDDFQRLSTPEARRLELGDVSRREHMRMALLVSKAEVALAEAEGEWAEARLGFAALLALDLEHIGELPPLEMLDTAPTLEVLQRSLANHPAIADSRAREAVHEAGIALARAESRPKFNLTLYRERDVFAGREEAVNGGALGVELPLWDRRQGRRGELGAQALGERQRRLALERQLALTLQATREHLLHLIEQTRHQARAVLAPAQEIHALTLRGYRLGEIGLDELIEARDTATAAEIRQQELRAETRATLAELRHAAGLSLSSHSAESLHEEQIP